MAKMHNNGSEVIHALHIHRIAITNIRTWMVIVKNRRHCRVQLKDDIEATEENIQF